MPLLLNTYKTSYRLALWATTEPLEFFENKAHFTPYDLTVYEKIVNPSRKKEWLAVRVLLNDVLGFWPQILYTESGKPLLQNHTRHLSISHSKEMVAILLCTTPFAGIDVERIDRNIDKVAQRFLSPLELKHIENEKIENERIKFWCAKEAIFKAVNEQNISFSKQIHIEILDQRNTILGHFYSENENIDFVLNSMNLNDHCIVWTTESTPK